MIDINFFVLSLSFNLIFFNCLITQAKKKFFVQRQRMLNRFGVKSGVLSLKIHLVSQIASSFEKYFYVFFL